MSSSIPDVSAIHCIRAQMPTSCTDKLTDWTIEDDFSSDLSTSTHLHFNAETGIYTVPKDGIYLLKVQLIPIGGPMLASAQRTRKRVKYALCIENPGADDQYLDIGSHNLGAVEHLQAGVMVSCIRLAGATGCDCVRLSICCIQRKRKREEEVVSKKEMKRRRRASNRTVRLEGNGSDDDIEDSSDSEWEHGFESDSTSDELPTSAKSVGRLAKRLKTVDSD